MGHSLTRMLMENIPSLHTRFFPCKWEPSALFTVCSNEPDDRPEVLGAVPPPRLLRALPNKLAPTVFFPLLVVFGCFYPIICLPPLKETCCWILEVTVNSQSHCTLPLPFFVSFQSIVVVLGFFSSLMLLPERDNLHTHTHRYKHRCIIDTY
jgi:hypothetical protein